MRKIISTDQAPAAVGPYSQAIQTSHSLFISGQLPIDPQTNQLVEGSIADQTRQVLQNILEILRALPRNSSASVRNHLLCLFTR